MVRDYRMARSQRPRLGLFDNEKSGSSVVDKSHNSVQMVLEDRKDVASRTAVSAELDNFGREAIEQIADWKSQPSETMVYPPRARVSPDLFIRRSGKTD